MRHWQRTEVGEAEEAFGKGQKGSSAMPHKKNPILSENLTGLARLLRAYARRGARGRRAVARARHLALVGGAGDRARRDAPADFMLQRAAGLVDGLVVHPERMRENLELDAGASSSPRA